MWQHFQLITPAVFLRKGCPSPLWVASCALKKKKKKKCWPSPTVVCIHSTVVVMGGCSQGFVSKFGYPQTAQRHGGWMCPLSTHSTMYIIVALHCPGLCTFVHEFHYLRSTATGRGRERFASSPDSQIFSIHNWEGPGDEARERSHGTRDLIYHPHVFNSPD